MASDILILISVIIGLSGLFLTIINVLVVIIMNRIFSSITHIEDKHVLETSELHKRIDEEKDACDTKREKIKTEFHTQQKQNDRDIHKAKSDIVRLAIHTKLPPAEV